MSGKAEAAVAIQTAQMAAKNVTIDLTLPEGSGSELEKARVELSKGFVRRGKKGKEEGKKILPAKERRVAEMQELRAAIESNDLIMINCILALIGEGEYNGTALMKEQIDVINGFGSAKREADYLERRDRSSNYEQVPFAVSH